jgi:hypothetical protein
MVILSKIYALPTIMRFQLLGKYAVFFDKY